MTPTLRSWWVQLKSRLRPIYPRLVLELSFDRWTLLRGEHTPQGPSLRRTRTVAFDPQAMVVEGAGTCAFDLEALRAALAELLAGEDELPRRVSLLLPDLTARGTLLDFETLPARRHDRIELIRWKLKRTTPFRVEEARISFQELPSANGHRRLLAVAAPEATLAPLEQLVASFDLEPVLVDLSTPNLWNLVADLAADQDLLLINRDTGFFTINYFRAGQLSFYRCKASANASDQESSEYLLQEIHASQLYLHERLELPSSKNFLVRDVVGDGLDRALQRRFDATVELVDPRPLVDLAGCAHLPAAQLQKLLPLMGALKGR
jgi:hypothetical protein